MNIAEVLRARQSGETKPIGWRECVAELLGAEADGVRASRWLIGLMVVCCDGLAIALTAVASARR
jgi:hypothetical protein